MSFGWYDDLSLEYDSAHWLVHKIDFDGSEATFEYDSFNRVTLVKEAGKRRTEFIYENCKGFDFWTPSETHIKGATQARAQILEPGRITEQMDGEGRKTTSTVDAFEKIEQTVDASGNALKFKCNLHEELIAAHNASGKHGILKEMLLEMLFEKLISLILKPCTLMTMAAD